MINIDTINVMKNTYLFIEDLDQVMERLCGNEALLNRLLNKFRDTYCNSRQKLGVLLDASEKEEAHRLVHSIKGVSANLGIGALYRLTVTLENRMKADEYDTLQTELDSFLRELEKVIEELQES